MHKYILLTPPLFCSQCKFCEGVVSIDFARQYFLCSADRCIYYQKIEDNFYKEINGIKYFWRNIDHSKTCKNCKHWINEECWKMNSSGGEPDDTTSLAVAYDKEGLYAWVVTSPDFACNMFEWKDFDKQFINPKKKENAMKESTELLEKIVKEFELFKKEAEQYKTRNIKVAAKRARKFSNSLAFLLKSYRKVTIEETR